MGVVTFKTKLSALKSDTNFRLDVKYGNFIVLDSSKLWNSSNCYELKNVLKPLMSSIVKKGELHEEQYLIDLSNIERKRNNLINLEIVAEIGSDKSVLKFGDLVIPKIEPKKGQFFLNLNHSEYIGSTELVEYEINKDEYNPFFLYYLLTTDKFLKVLSYLESGKTHKRVSAENLLKIKVPKIPIAIQNELAKKIQPIETEITYLKTSKLKPIDIINKVFGEAFGFDGNYYYKEFGKGMTAGTQQSKPKEKTIYKIPFSYIAKSNIMRVSSRFHNSKMQFVYKRLHSKPIIKIKDILKEKAHRGASPQYDTDGEVPVIKTAHLKNGYIEISEDEFVNEDFYKKSIRSQVYENDVLIASTGKVSLGKVDIVLSDQNLVVDGHVTILSVKQDLYNPLFLTYFLRSILGTFQIERDFTGATNQIELYSSEIENFDIPSFSLAKQTEIVEKIKSQLDAQKVIDSQIEEKHQTINKLIEEAIQKHR